MRASEATALALDTELALGDYTVPAKQVIDGVKAIVPGAEAADLFIVSAAIDGEPRSATVEAVEDGALVRHGEP